MWSLGEVKVSGEKYYHKSTQVGQITVMRMGEIIFDNWQGRKVQEMTIKVRKASKFSAKHVKSLPSP